MKNSARLLLILIVAIAAHQAYCLPRFAVRLGDRCIDCHYNPTGGLIKSLDGWYWGKNNLSMISPRDSEFPMSPKLNDNISIGIDYRTQFLYSQQRDRADFQNMSGSLYTNFSLSKKMNVIGKYDFVNRIWEGYGVARIFPGGGYVKAGAFTPNYGIRIDDHTAFTRGGNFGLLFSQGAFQGLIYNPFYTEAGVELGFYAGDLLFATASAGSNLLSNRTLSKDPTYTARMEITPRIDKFNFILGGSFAAAKIPQAVEMYGGFLGFGFDEFAFLAEFDAADELILSGRKSTFLMIETSYGIVTGLDAVIRYDRLDPSTAAGSDEVSQLIAGVEFQPYTFIGIKPQYRIVFDSANPGLKNDSFVLQLHFWY